MKVTGRTAIPFRAAMYLGVASLAMIAAIPAQAQAIAGKQLNIPAQSLAKTLTQIGLQTGNEVVFSPNDVRSRRAPAVNGALTADQAFAVALQGSGLVARRTAQGAYVIARNVSQSNTPVEEAPDYSAGHHRHRAEKSGIHSKSPDFDQRVQRAGIG